MGDFLGCGEAQNRPVCCKMENNLCCRKCEHQTWCLEQVRNGLTGKIKTIPCFDSDFETDEVCAFGC